MQIADRQHIAKVLALVRAAGKGWYGVAVGNTMLNCARCGRPRKALCSPGSNVRAVCADCYPLAERELDRAVAVYVCANAGCQLEQPQFVCHEPRERRCIRCGELCVKESA
jgi:hypothetical protein